MGKTIVESSNEVPNVREDAAVVDAWEFLEPVDIIKKVPSDFSAQLSSQKWQDRKEALENLLKLLNFHPRLSPSAQYADIIQLLKEVNLEILFGNLKM